MKGRPRPKPRPPLRDQPVRRLRRHRRTSPATTPSTIRPASVMSCSQLWQAPSTGHSRQSADACTCRRIRSETCSPFACPSQSVTRPRAGRCSERRQTACSLCSYPAASTAASNSWSRPEVTPRPTPRASCVVRRLPRPLRPPSCRRSSRASARSAVITTRRDPCLSECPRLSKTPRGSQCALQ